jgi:hypothetical protein
MWWLSHLDDLRAALSSFLFRGDATGYEGLVIGTHLPLSGVLRPPPANVLANIVHLGGRDVLAKFFMDRTNTGMQLSVWLRKQAS